MATLGFIPARGGSKGILKKNLVDLLGKPLIQYSLDIVKSLSHSSVIPFISTDDAEISVYCRSQGFDMSYRRPAHISGDDSAVIDAVFDALDWCHYNVSEEIDSVLLLQPTNPLRSFKEAESAISRFRENDLDSLVSVTHMKEHPFDCIETYDSSWEYLKKPKSKVTNRQQHTKNFFFIDGTFYIVKIGFLQKYQSFVVEGKTDLFVLNRNWPIDIDELEDLRVAEVVMADRDL